MFKRYGLLTEIKDVGRRSSWISIFVNFGITAMFPSWISSPAPNLKNLAQAIQIYDL